jgi:branched-chain amino acid aminotransferase
MTESVQAPEPARAAAALQALCKNARVFLSMPWLDGVTPRLLGTARGEIHASGEPSGRRHGIFRLDELGLSVLDHGALYGDAVFEGVLIAGSRLLLWREHLERLDASARKLEIPIRYGPVDLTRCILETVRSAGSGGGRRYIRLVVTRGLGDLGINPRMCLGATIYAIVAEIQLYPEELYRRGIRLSIARRVRRAGPSVLDPNVKSCNYLNNILGLVTTAGEGTLETLMLTSDGYVAEATADNFFLVARAPGWERDPSRVSLLTPSGDHCLRGITRDLVLAAARRLGYRVEETSTMLPGDAFGPDREAFLTGTGAGLMPVVAIDGRSVGDGQPGSVSSRLREELECAMADPRNGLGVDAREDEIERYLGDALRVRTGTPGSVTGGFDVERNR